MSLLEQPRLVLDRHFADIDEYGQEVGWDLDFRQLDAGSLHARAAVMATSRSAAIRVAFNRAFQQAGSPPRGVLTFGLPDPEVAEFKWCGADASGGDILNFNLSSGFEGVSGAGFSGYTLSFSEALLHEVMRALDIELDLRASVSEFSTWTETRHVTTRVRQQLTAAYRAATASRNRGCPQGGRLFHCGAAALILQSLSREEGRKAPQELSLRRRAVRSALVWLDEHHQLPFTVSDLCRQTGVSAPTLYRGFLEEFGIGPKRYLLIRRLSGVRDELRSAERKTRITDIANRWGFWHMGQFAADYRQHFGELPSETLASATGRLSST